MKQARTFIIFLVITFVFTSCGDGLLNDDFRGGDWFYLESKGAVMPVWVTGNKASNTFVIFLHGGGDSGVAMSALATAFKQLEREYALVYYDQRGAGTAQGNPDNDSFTVEQHVEDLQKLIHLIRHKYGNPNIFLMGHSWGGAFGTAYLLDANNQQYISGWIMIDGAYNYVDSITLSFEWVKQKAQENIDNGIDVSYWQKELAWYAGITPSWDHWGKHEQNADKLNGAFYNPSNRVIILEQLKLIFNTPLSLNIVLNAQNRAKYLKVNDINFSSELQKITVPSLVIWGRHDGLVPVELGQFAYDGLGTVSNDKYLHIFEYSAHTPYLEQPQLFFEKIKEFVDKYK